MTEFYYFLYKFQCPINPRSIPAPVTLYTLHPGAATLKILQSCVVHLVSGRDPLAWLLTYGCMLGWRKAWSAYAAEVNPKAQRPRTLEGTMIQPLPLGMSSGSTPIPHLAGGQLQCQGDGEAHRPCTG